MATRSGAMPLRTSSAPACKPVDIAVPPCTRIASMRFFSSTLLSAGENGTITAAVSSKTTTEIVSVGSSVS